MLRFLLELLLTYLSFTQAFHPLYAGRMHIKAALHTRDWVMSTTLHDKDGEISATRVTYEARIGINPLNAGQFSKNSFYCRLLFKTFKFCLFLWGIID